MFQFQEHSWGNPRESRLSSFMYKVYAWMALGLIITAFVAYFVANNDSIRTVVLQNQWAFLAIVIAQLVLVVAISGAINRLSFQTALIGFALYAALVGCTLSWVFLAFTAASIYSTFFITASMFAAMAFYGYFTRADLTAIGSFGVMALFGLIIGMVVNIFLKSPGFDIVLSGVGVIIFTLLTAFDVQKIKNIAQQIPEETGLLSKVALLGALTLYLDFINLFLFMLRFTGNRRE